MQKDPVCGAQVDEKKGGAPTSSYHGKQYYFCATGCKDKFDQQPDRYAEKQPTGAASR